MLKFRSRKTLELPWASYPSYLEKAWWGSATAKQAALHWHRKIPHMRSVILSISLLPAAIASRTTTIPLSTGTNPWVSIIWERRQQSICGCLVRHLITTGRPLRTYHISKWYPDTNKPPPFNHDFFVGDLIQFPWGPRIKPQPKRLDHSCRGRNKTPRKFEP